MLLLLLSFSSSTGKTAPRGSSNEEDIGDGSKEVSGRRIDGL